MAADRDKPPPDEASRPCERIQRVSLNTRGTTGGIALERYDLVIIGGGAAGINALKTAVTLEARVVLVDRGPLGGTCVNRG
jgi:NADPH-dependent 2,4-dienoyl-CoA reductase/sulfur reductase-like enzyme